MNSQLFSVNHVLTFGRMTCKNVSVLLLAECLLFKSTQMRTEIMSFMGGSALER